MSSDNSNVFSRLRGIAAAEIAAGDWSGHALGPPAGWPPQLLDMLATILSSPQAMFLAWGPDLHFFFNDAYRPILGLRTQYTQGRRFDELWADEWSDLKPVVDRALGGEGVSFEDWPLQVTRNGVLEQTWWTFSYMPLRDAEGRIVGMWCITSDATPAVVGRQAAAAERDRQKHSLQRMPGFVAILAGPDHVFEYVNDAYVAIAGARDYIGRPLRRVLPELEGQGFYELLDHTYATGEPFSAKGAPLRLAGSDRQLYVDLHYAAIRDEDGKVTGIFIGGYDVTEAYQDQHALQALNTDLERQVIERSSERGAIWQISPFMLSVVDLTDGRFIRVNPAWCDELGYTAEEIVGRSYLEFLHPDDLARTMEGYAEVEGGRPVLDFENRYRHKDGDYRWLSWVAVPENGKLYSTVRNVTADKAAASARDRILELSRDLIGVATYDGWLKSINPAWSRALGRPDAELLSKPFAGIIHPDDLAETGAVVAALQSGRPVHQFHVRLLKADGEPVSFAWSAAPDPDPDSGLFYTVGRDITDDIATAAALRETQEALRQSQKMEAVGQLTGGIAHDFNNLLAGISGALELIQKRMTEQGLAGFERHLSIAQISAGRAAALTQRLLAFSRRQTLDPKALDANRLIGGVEDLIRRSVGPGIEIDVVGAIGLWTIKVDGPQLENALLNLAINARDAMPDGGRITIETANKWLDERAAKDRDLPPGQYISVCVTDTGTGMSPEVTERAFDPFFTTKPLGQGTGLGLSMIHGFVRQSGGQVRIYSEPGQGSTLCLYFPRFLGDAEQDDAEQEGQGLEPGHGETVLVIDDEEPIRMLINDVLGEAGYRVLEAADGPSGLKILQSEARIDLLITDVGLPGGFNGRQVADAARQTRPALKVLFVTGYAENAVVGNGHLDPGMQVITKPFPMTALALRVREIIEG